MTLAATVTIGVFGLFHPHALDIEPWRQSRIELSCVPHQTLERTARVRLTADCKGSGSNGAPTDFILSVPGRIRRHYQGTLKVTRQPTGELIAAVTMTLETAVASTVAAEAPPDAAKAMLEAQAVVTRSYFAAIHNRHQQFDFCDTTHCQFIKDPPAPDSGFAQATLATTGRVLTYHYRIVPAFYAARCDGLLAPLPASRIGPNEYPYFAATCDFCLRTPAKSTQKANARPHHHGMCQLGANDLAKRGWTASQILAHYYPGADLR